MKMNLHMFLQDGMALAVLIISFASPKSKFRHVFYWEEALGDHKIVEAHFHIPISRPPTAEWLPWKNYECRPGVIFQERKNVVAQAWVALRIAPLFLHLPPEPDKEWGWFNYQIQQMFQKAFRAARTKTPCGGRDRGKLDFSVGHDDRAQG